MFISYATCSCRTREIRTDESEIRRIVQSKIRERKRERERKIERWIFEIMHDEVSETEHIRANLAIERSIAEGCDVLLDVNQVLCRQGLKISKK